MDGGEIDTADATEIAVESGDAGGEPQPRDYEAEARAHGWTPKEEFKGDAAKWVDAETFARRADEVMPFLKKQNTALKREIDDLKKTFKQASAHFSKTEERAYNRALTELQAKMDEAVETGDKAAHRAAMKELDELKADAPKPVDEFDEAAEEKRIEEWVDRTEWYGPDEARTKYADAQANLMGHVKDYPGGGEAWLTELERRVDKKFAVAKPNPVNPGGNRGGAKGGKSFADLPPEAKAMCDKWVKSGLIASREEYVKSYDFS